MSILFGRTSSSMAVTIQPAPLFGSYFYGKSTYGYLIEQGQYPESVNEFCEGCSYQSASPSPSPSPSPSLSSSETGAKKDDIVGTFISLLPIEEVDLLAGCCDCCDTELWDNFLPRRSGEKRKEMSENGDDCKPPAKRRRMSMHAICCYRERRIWNDYKKNNFEANKNWENGFPVAAAAC